MLTIARLSAEKGVDLALETCEALLREGIRVKWFMIGDGPDKAVLTARIRERGLENAFVLLGRTHNPYKYLAHCDVYVQPSRYEGKSIALEEAKLLAKPIVATAFSTVRDQLEDRCDRADYGCGPRCLGCVRAATHNRRAIATPPDRTSCRRFKRQRERSRKVFRVAGYIRDTTIIGRNAWSFIRV